MIDACQEFFVFFIFTVGYCSCWRFSSHYARKQHSANLISSKTAVPRSLYDVTALWWYFTKTFHRPRLSSSTNQITYCGIRVHSVNMRPGMAKQKVGNPSIYIPHNATNPFISPWLHNDSRQQFLQNSSCFFCQLLENIIKYLLTLWSFLLLM